MKSNPGEKKRLQKLKKKKFFKAIQNESRNELNTESKEI